MYYYNGLKIVTIAGYDYVVEDRNRVLDEPMLLDDYECGNGGFAQHEKNRYDDLMDLAESTRLIDRHLRIPVQLIPKHFKDLNAIEPDENIIRRLATQTRTPKLRSPQGFETHFNGKTVLTYGTFDLLHYGHIRLLKRARKLGDRLLVGLSSDYFNILKDKECVMPYRVRRMTLQALDIVDGVFSEYDWNQKEKDIKKYSADILVMGDDWKGKFDDLPCEVVYLPRTKNISTTKVKEYINE